MMSLLFTFQARPGEEYTSDSLDSDYCPGRESSDEDYSSFQKKRRNHIKRKKRTKLTTSKSSASKRKLRKTVHGSGDDVSEASNGRHNGDSFHLPPEVMLKIFRYGIEDVGIINFLPSVARVCKEWNRIASDPSVLEHLDLSKWQIVFTRKNQSSLVKFLKRDVSRCHHLSLSGQGHLGPSIIEHVLNLMPRLRTLDLDGCNVKPNVIRRLPQMCPLIQRINLSSCAESNFLYQQRKNTLASLEALITGLGANLLELRLSNINVVQQYLCQVLKVIRENCSNLEELDLNVYGLRENNDAVMADMEGLAHDCPRLKELYLDGFNLKDNSLPTQNFQTQKPYANCFKNLQVYSQARHIQNGRGFPEFYRLFGSVDKLRVLNVSHSRLLPSLIAQWVKKVDKLYLQGMRWLKIFNEHLEMIQCVAAWCMSLRTLDLSFNKPDGLIIDEALSQYSGTSHPDGYPLRILNLSNTNVTPQGVIHVISVCKNLQEINLTYCRELPRGTKQEFNRSDFSFLLKSLHSFLQDNSSDGIISSTSDSDD